MGIYCEINLLKPPNGVFRAGELVSGVIKYSTDEPTEFKKIIVSLKGMGHLRIIDRLRRRRGGRHLYTDNEIYIDDDFTKEGNDEKTPIGSEEINFSFNIPRNIPSSMEYDKVVPRYYIRCYVRYYVRIKFEPPGWFSFAKHFKKEITIVSDIIPKLPTEPVIYGKRKKPTQLFATKLNIVNIKANILNSIIASGDKIKLECEVRNNTNLVIKRFETKLLEEYTFSPKFQRNIKVQEDIPNTYSKTEPIASTYTIAMSLEVNLPNHLISLDNAKIVKRNYFICLTAVLPIPHRNMILMIPVQIGNTERMVVYDDPPPSYWEAMDEGKKENERK